MSQKIRIKLKSYDHNLVDKSAEKIVKKSIRADKRNDFKELMKNRKWSWKDANSLKVLVDYF